MMFAAKYKVFTEYELQKISIEPAVRHEFANLAREYNLEGMNESDMK